MDNEELLERVEMLYEEMCRVKRAVYASINGEAFTEAFNEEVYLEAKQNKNNPMLL